jgi:hypothetical protein
LRLREKIIDLAKGCTLGQAIREDSLIARGFDRESAEAWHNLVKKNFMELYAVFQHPRALSGAHGNGTRTKTNLIGAGDTLCPTPGTHLLRTGARSDNSLTMTKTTRVHRTWSDLDSIDSDKLRHLLERSTVANLTVMFARAIGCLPAEAYERVFTDYAFPDDLAADQERSPGLLEAVHSFVECAQRGDYYDPVFFSGQHYDEWPRATHNFSARIDLLLGRCKAESANGDPFEVCRAYELLFELVRDIDARPDDVVFFPDEANSWQLGIRWASELPSYFACLSQTIGRDELAARKVALVQEFDPMGIEGLELALTCTSPAP